MSRVHPKLFEAEETDRQTDRQIIHSFNILSLLSHLTVLKNLF